MKIVENMTRMEAVSEEEEIEGLNIFFTSWVSKFSVLRYLHGKTDFFWLFLSAFYDIITLLF